MSKLKTAQPDSLNHGNLVRLLMTFDKAEMREFEKYVLSPYHNNRAEVTRFFLELKKYFPEFNNRGLAKKRFFSLLYPGQLYRDDVLRRLQSNLFKLAESFIAHRALELNKFEFNKYILDYYYSNFVDNLYRKQYKYILKYTSEQSARSSKYYNRIFLIEETNRSYKTKSDPTRKSTNIQTEFDSFLIYSLIGLLRMYSLAINDISIFNKNYRLEHIDSILDIAERAAFMGNKIIEIYWLAIKLDTTSRNEKTFFRLDTMLEKCSKTLEQEESIRIYNCLLSYCFEMKLTPGNDFKKIEFILIKRMLESGLLTVGNTIYPEWFMYAFLSSVRAGEISFAGKFIRKYETMLPENERFNIINHANAELAIEKKDYQKALKLLALPKYNSINEKLRANQMYIKIYYETTESDQFFYQVNSFSQIMRNVTSLNKERGIIPRTNFIKFAEKLFKVKIGESKSPVYEIKREIMKSKILGNSWLLEKAEELESLKGQKKNK